MAGCTLTPDVPESAISDPDAAWPSLVPLAELDARTAGFETRPVALQTETKELAARVAALRARAARLNGPILTDRERQNLAEAVVAR